MKFNLTISKLIREVQFRSFWKRYFFPRYDYNFTPPQLCFLCECLDKTKGLAGSIAEIGCGAGKTTVFLNKYLDAQEIIKDYVAIDTFSGFTPTDVQYEISERHKKEKYRGFRMNSQKWFDGTMRLNSITRVTSICADVNEFDLTQLGELAFVLLDVDLYRPTKKALKELYRNLAPGGILIVDDCGSTPSRWDGADQAYGEFIKEFQLPELILYGKLGVIQKAAQ